MKVTKFEIDMLDVKAADAFLIHAFTENPFGEDIERIVLVDAGNEGDGEKIFNHIYKYYSQHCIDLAIITHCDSDHYGGMEYLINKNNERNDFHINQVWVNDPYNHVTTKDVKRVRKDETLHVRLNEVYSFNDGSNLLELLDESGIERKEAFTKDTFWPLNITVLGPDKDYYESLIPDFRVDLDFKEEQPDDLYEGLACFSQTEDEFYSRALEEASDDPSKVNQSSIVFVFDANGDKYLFTGDAGKEALRRVINEDTLKEIEKVTWLKVPHHGSKHNLNNEIIKYFYPSISYISTEKYGKYASRCTVNALKKTGDVYSTHKGSSLRHYVGMDDRDGYSPAKKL